MAVLFLLSEDAAQEWTNPERWEDARSESGGVDFFRSWAARHFIARGDKAAQTGECSGFARVRADLAGSDGHARAAVQVISQQNELVGVGERERAQQDAFDKGEDCRSRADTEGQHEDDGYAEPGGFKELAKCEAEIADKR